MPRLVFAGSVSASNPPPHPTPGTHACSRISGNTLNLGNTSKNLPPPFLAHSTDILCPLFGEFRDTSCYWKQAGSRSRFFSQNRSRICLQDKLKITPFFSIHFFFLRWVSNNTPFPEKCGMRKGSHHCRERVWVGVLNHSNYAVFHRYNVTCYTCTCYNMYVNSHEQAITLD